MVESPSLSYRFLEGGGELGLLTRSFNWAGTSVGPVEQWPQSLRTMVDTILHSEFPMFLWWGEDMIQFYNDAYRPSMGNDGKHPAALGQKGVECWPEIWPVIKPLIDRVRQGGATWSQDQLIPIYRNGKLEDVYWTFGYSPVRDDSGNVAGVLVICNETTRQVNAIKKIEQSEKTLRSIIVNAPVGICIIQGDPPIVEVANDIYLELVGKTKEELEGKLLWEALPEARDQYASIVREAGLSGIPYEGKEQILTLLVEGEKVTKYVDFVYEPMPADDDVGSQKIMVLAIDITDKVLARKKIEESEQRYKTLVSESTVAIAMYLGPELRIYFVNQIMTGYWGRDMSVIGKTFKEALPELEGQGFIEKMESVYATGESYVGTAEEARLLVNGRLQSSYYNYVFKALRNTDGQVYGIHHMAMDITAQVLDRKKVEQSEANLRNIILKAPVAMCILRGADFIVEIANDLMFDIWGKKREELINRPIFEGLPEVKYQGFEALLEEVFTTGKTFTAYATPLQVPRQGNIETIYVNFVYEPFYDSEGIIAGIMAVATDVTVQVKARQRVEDLVEERTEELAESNKNLRRSNAELAQFAYIASHDLQEPARKIRTFIEMLQKNLPDIDPRSKNFLDKIEHSSTRMLSLIRDILSYSQLANIKQEPVRIDLNDVLKSIMSDFELLIEDKQATITSDKLPVIHGIPIQISQMFANLISNGLKFSRGDRKCLIAISCEKLSMSETKEFRDLNDEWPYFRITFSDNGIGFSQQNARQIFDIFQRLHGKSEYEGTGIGLAMCKKIAENHHGTIYAEATPGEGATFHVLLPERISN